MTRAVELYERAAELGSKEAHYSLGCLYGEGTEVEKDTAKAIRHYESAAMSGHVLARFNLGCEEFEGRNYNLSLQHTLIAAKMDTISRLTKLRQCTCKVGLPRPTIQRRCEDIRALSKECKAPTATKLSAGEIRGILEVQDQVKWVSVAGLIARVRIRPMHRFVPNCPTLLPLPFLLLSRRPPPPLLLPCPAVISSPFVPSPSVFAAATSTSSAGAPSSLPFPPMSPATSSLHL